MSDGPIEIQIYVHWPEERDPRFGVGVQIKNLSNLEECEAIGKRLLEFFRANPDVIRPGSIVTQIETTATVVDGTDAIN